MTKPGLPQGTRDFGPDTLRKRNYIFNSIRNAFETYGFQPLETPAMENLETLLGKYGEEGDKLIFKVLNNGLNDPKHIDKSRAAFETVLEGKNNKLLTERALRYDLTIPFARYVAMNFGQIQLPFKRYQIQPVWRADRPQKGRYREFFQCDADIVGSYSLLNEAELTILYAKVFETLGIGVTIKLNNRKVLGALATICGHPDWLHRITVAIDKLDKIGIEKVMEELSKNGLKEDQLVLITKYLRIAGSNAEKIQSLNALVLETEEGKKGIEELSLLLEYIAPYINNAELDLTLARGLNYYTGTIFEVKAKNVQMGSIGGGGRYDDLTGLMGQPGIPGVGISFGVDRIYDVMEELKLFPSEVHAGTRVLFFNLGIAESREAFRQVQALRDKGIAGEIYYEAVKFDKQFKYAEKKNIPFVAIIGDKELASQTITIKDLRNGEQILVNAKDLMAFDFK
ncbi:MAG: histidine--tRNA ligase [Chitinophagales bacterium]